MVYQRAVSLFLCRKYRSDISGITTKAPCEAALMGERHVRIEISDFALRTFVSFFDITQYSPRSLVEKRFLSLLFSKKINQSIFPLRCLSKIVEKFLFLIPYYPLHFLLVCFRIVLQNLYER